MHFLVIYLVAGMIEGPVLVEPDTKFAIGSEADEFSVYVKGTKFFVEFVESAASIPEDVQTLLEGQLGEIAESIFDSLRVHVEGDCLGALAKILLLLLSIGLLRTVDFIHLDEPKLVILSHFVYLQLVIHIVVTVEDNPPPFSDHLICSFIMIDAVVIAIPFPFVFG
jgi:hypothetical protein